MSVKLRDLRLFLAVAEDLHFSAAARRMRIAQPALSRTIRGLERQIGTELFRRSTRRVELTQAGQAFRLEIRDAVDHFDHAMRMARLTATGHAGVLRIAYMDFAIEGMFPSILRAYRSRHPDVTVEARASFTEQIIADLRSGAIDVGFVIGPIDDPDLATLAVQRDRYVAVVPDAHPLARRSRVRLADLAGEPLVLGRRQSWLPYVRRVEALCRDAGFTPNVVQEADTTESIFAFVASGIGSTIYLDRDSQYGPPGVRVLALDDVRETISTHLAWRLGDRDRVIGNFVSLSRELTRTD